jgi:TPP-dependent indolepyruvate ferredoxin oxidoreductase alpha subunit
MHDGICEILLENNVQLLYVTSRVVEKTVKKMVPNLPSFHCETSINEKIAFELALTGSWASKRTACLVSSDGLYEALDPLMSSAYTGVAGSFLIVAVQENTEEITPFGPFSKLPVLVTEDADEFSGAVEYGYHISEKYRIPVIVQTVPFKEDARRPTPGIRDSVPEMTPRLRDPATRWPAEFVKTPARWAATPGFRYELHRELNNKIERIRAEHESYKGNRKIIKSETGLITDRLSYREFYDDDTSVLKISTVYPLPEKLVMDFINSMDEVFISETYPAIEFQIPEKSRVHKGPAGMASRGPKPEETIGGFRVVRDKLGPASSINMAHGIKKCGPEEKVLAITYEDFFLHSGMPSFVNTIHNGSDYVSSLWQITGKRK